jgi:hypothetical protein
VEIQLLRLRDLGIDRLRTRDCRADAYMDWTVVSTSDVVCTNCHVLMIIIAKNLKPEFPADTCLICPSCLDFKLFGHLPMQQQSIFADRFASLLDQGLDKVASAQKRLLESMALLFAGHSGSLADINTVSVPGGIAELGEATIPNGFRSISWIRPYEAEAIIRAHKNREDFELKSGAGQVVLKCLYYPNDSEEALKFRSNVQTIRVNNSNQRVIGWIRLEEAEAILEAHRIRADKFFEHVNAGNGGMVQFFAEDSDVAKKYRSTTRLLRKDHA